MYPGHVAIVYMLAALYLFRATLDVATKLCYVCWSLGLKEEGSDCCSESHDNIEFHFLNQRSCCKPRTLQPHLSSTTVLAKEAGGCSRHEKFMALEIFFGYVLVLGRGAVKALVIILVLDVLFFAKAYGIEWNGNNGVVSYV